MINKSQRRLSIEDIIQPGCQPRTGLITDLRTLAIIRLDRIKAGKTYREMKQLDYDQLNLRITI